MENKKFSFEDVFEMVDINLAIASATFADSYTEILESMEMYENEELFVEAKKATVGEALRIFIAAIVNALEKMRDAISTSVQEKLFSMEYKKKIADLREEVKSAKALGRKTVSLPDYPNIMETYDKMVAELGTLADKIASNNYKRTEDLNNDVRLYEDKMRSYDSELTRLFNTEKQFPIRDVINFVENEANHGGLLKSLNASIKRFREMEGKVSRLETREAILGQELITKQVVIIKKTSNSFVKQVRKWISRIIGKIVFYFA